MNNTTTKIFDLPNIGDSRANFYGKGLDIRRYNTMDKVYNEENIMTIEIGDLFRIKETGEIIEITSKWGADEYRHNCYKANGYPDCGANGQHNIACNVSAWYAAGGLEKLAPLPTRRTLIKTFNYGNYYGKRFLIDNNKE